MRRIVASAVMAVSLLFGIAGTAQAVTPASPVPAPDTAHKPQGVKAPKGQPDGNKASMVACSSTCYSYAGQGQAVTAADGVAINASIHNPALLSTDYHSLWETLIRSSDLQQVVELGWTVDLAVCGSAANSPCLFTYAWVNGIGLCYNGCGFVNAIGCSPYCMGSPVTGLVGSTKGFSIQHLGGGSPGWWIAFDGTWRGYWPDSLWSGAAPPVTFTTGGEIQAFGEIAAGNDPTETDMGNGVLANSTTVGAVTGGYQVITGGVGAAGSWSGNIYTDLTRWDLTSVSATSFRYGGPGGNENLPTTSPTCSGVGISPTWGGYGSFCPYGNTSGGVPISPVNALDTDATVARNVCHPNWGTADGITTSPIRVFENTSYVKFAWFRDANCAGAHIDVDYDKTVLPAGWTALTHASFMRWSTPNSH